MDLHAEQRFPGTPEEVAAMFADEAFVRRWCEATGAIQASVTVDGAVDATTPGPFVVTTARAFSTERFPSFARKFVGETLHIAQTDRWSQVEGVWSADSEVSTTGAPARLTARVTLTAQGDLTVQVVDGTVKASVPFVSGKVEALMHEQVVRALGVQEKVGRDWLMG